MKRVVDGVEYVEVPSDNCHSLVGKIKCSIYYTDDRCKPLRCTKETNGKFNICFLTNAQYLEWLEAKLTS